MDYCVLAPVRNGSKWLPEFLNCLESFKLQPLRTYFLLNNCSDRSKDILKSYANRVGRTTIIEYDYKDAFFHPIEERYKYVSHLCKVRNALIDVAIQHDSKWSHALIHDITKLSPINLPDKLLSIDESLVSPLILREDVCSFWDLSNFRDIYNCPFKSAPPFFTGSMISEVASVGSVVMVKREVFSVARFTPSKDDFDGTFVNFCHQARSYGHSCWVLRDVCSTAPIFLRKKL